MMFRAWVNKGALSSTDFGLFHANEKVSIRHRVSFKKFGRTFLAALHYAKTAYTPAQFSSPCTTGIYLGRTQLWRWECKHTAYLMYLWTWPLLSRNAIR